MSTTTTDISKNATPRKPVPTKNSVLGESIDLIGQPFVSWFPFHVDAPKPSVFLLRQIIAFSRSSASRDSSAPASAFGS